jgi:hypothetical protein
MIAWFPSCAVPWMELQFTEAGKPDHYQDMWPCGQLILSSNSGGLRMQEGGMVDHD